MGVVKQGLDVYWNYKQGVVNRQWKNIAPNTLGKHNLELNGPILNSEGMYFDAVDDDAFTTLPDYVMPPTGFAMEFIGTIHSFGGASPVDGFIALGALDTAGHGSFYPLLTWLDYSPFIPELLGGFFCGATMDGNPYILPYTIPFNKSIHVQVNHDFLSRLSKFVVNGVVIGSVDNIGAVPSDAQSLATGIFEGIGAVVTVKSIKVYNRLLNQSELTQNLQNGSEIGLVDAPVIKYPTVTSIIMDKSDISDKSTVNQTILKVRFDKDVFSYCARLNGKGYDTGTLVHESSGVTAGNDAEVIVDWNELASEGKNRINVYGMSSTGEWTPYID